MTIETEPMNPGKKNGLLFVWLLHLLLMPLLPVGDIYWNAIQQIDRDVTTHVEHVDGLFKEKPKRNVHVLGNLIQDK